MKPNSPGERLYNGIIKENPTFVLVLGMCPTLAVTTAAMNGLGMGLTLSLIHICVSYAIIFSNLLIPIIERFTRPTAFGKGGKK